MFKVTMHAFSVHTYTCTYMYMHVLLFPQDNIPDQVITRIQPYIDNEDFTPVAISKVSKACTSICQWVRAMHKYHFVAKAVEPKRVRYPVTMSGSLVVTADLCPATAIMTHTYMYLSLLIYVYMYIPSLVADVHANHLLLIYPSLATDVSITCR